MNNSKPSKITDPALLGESVRSSAEALQQTGEFNALLEEAIAANEMMPIFEQNLICYIEQIIETKKEKELPIVESNENTQILNLEELRSSRKELNK